MPDAYRERLTVAVARWRAKFPAEYDALTAEETDRLAVPLQFRRDGLPAWAQLVVADRVAERIRAERGWPTRETVETEQHSA